MNTPPPAEVRPNVFWFDPPSGGAMYVVRTKDGLVVLDTGLLRHREHFETEMTVRDLDPADLCLGFVSHFHCDHVGGMGWWAETFHFPVVAHERAASPMETADHVITGSHLPYCGFDEPFVPCPVPHRVQGGERFEIGERTFTAVYAPGHTAGSIHVQVDDLLFVGDTLFGNSGIGWMDAHWGSNPEDYVETLERMRPSCGCLVLPGHGEPFALTVEILDRAQEIASFYIPTAHGLGAPRAPSGYGHD